MPQPDGKAHVWSSFTRCCDGFYYVVFSLQDVDCNMKGNPKPNVYIIAKPLPDLATRSYTHMGTYEFLLLCNVLFWIFFFLLEVGYFNA